MTIGVNGKAEIADDTTPDLCRCTGRVACEWVTVGSEHVSRCIRCGGKRTDDTEGQEQ